jgi:hypothetical protein
MVPSRIDEWLVLIVDNEGAHGQRRVPATVGSKDDQRMCVMRSAPG